MPDKDFKIRFSAKDDGFGSEVSRVKTALDSIGKSAGEVTAAFSGGLLGGGAVGVLISVIERVGSLIRETANLVDRARGIGLSPKEAIGTYSKARFTGLRPEAVLAARESAQQMRAEALDGDPDAMAAFQALGIGMENLAVIKAKDIFARVADALRGRDITSELQHSAYGILGQSAAEILPFAVKNGARAFTGDSFESNPLGGLMAYLLGGRFSEIQTFLNGGNPNKADLDPVSTYKFQREAAARRLGEQNRFRAAEIARSQLSIEQQINDILSQRVQIERDLASAPSELRRQQLISRLLDADQSLAALRAKQAGAASPEIKGTNIQRNLDELSRAGFFTNGSPVALGNIQADQLKELKAILDQLRKAPSETAKAL